MKTVTEGTKRTRESEGKTIIEKQAELTALIEKKVGGFNVPTIDTLIDKKRDEIMHLLDLY